MNPVVKIQSTKHLSITQGGIQARELLFITVRGLRIILFDQGSPSDMGLNFKIAISEIK